ncbi:DUF1993 domain-containing protein [Niveibacterium umoris]|uniref:DUF1993 domain-containing protein n=1 Tax=Niveibacterium umoris TaxID=1193620 RepID=A0A840BGA2_9RHOO|nr:DUF1993 domain-containing protein [Niveibacterium umoris]MBB4012571.1 hypothetical protein [Niveibacterium umoris]
MTCSLYTASVPVFSRYLRQLDTMLDKAARHVSEQRGGDATLLAARLAPDMFPLRQQISTAIGFSLRACAPVAARAVPVMPPGDADFAALRARIAFALAWLADLPPDQIDGGATRTITTMAGQATHTLNGADYLLHYALPNFFFHLGMAYAILRAQGVPLGKPDFDGFHAYAPGFSFPLVSS